MTQFQYLDGGTTEAQNKLAVAYVFEQASEGIAKTGVLSGLGVAQTATAGPNVVVGAGSGTVQASRLNGVDQLVNDTDYTLDVLTANPVGGLPRNDIVVIDQATLPNAVRVIVGTPNATPTDPTVPATAIPLARLRHAASATTVPTAKIDDLRTFVKLRGIPDVPVAGAWQTVAVTASSGWTATSGLAPEARLLPNGDVEIAGAVTAGTSISNNVVLTLPVGMRPSKTRYLPAHRTSGSGGGQVFQPYVTSSGQLTIEPTYSGGSLTASVAYPISGVIPL